jgi:hypothetical protein
MLSSSSAQTSPVHGAPPLRETPWNFYFYVITRARKMSHYVMDLAGRTIFLLTDWEENVKSRKLYSLINSILFENWEENAITRFLWLYTSVEPMKCNCTAGHSLVTTVQQQLGNVPRSLVNLVQVVRVLINSGRCSVQISVGTITALRPIQRGHR